jgi:hypothetical protein
VASRNATRRRRRNQRRRRSQAVQVVEPTEASGVPHQAEQQREPVTAIEVTYLLGLVVGVVGSVIGFLGVWLLSGLSAESAARGALVAGIVGLVGTVMANVLIYNAARDLTREDAKHWRFYASIHGLPAALFVFLLFGGLGYWVWGLAAAGVAAVIVGLAIWLVGRSILRPAVG